MKRPINVLIVDDSAVARSLLTHMLGADPDIRVLGTASSGEEAIQSIKQNQPDVITMDINMPHMDGLEATRQIMETTPIPIVIVSVLVDSRSVDITFKAMEAGALAVLTRPHGIGHPDYAKSSVELLRTVKLMSEIKVVRRWARLRGSITLPLHTGQLSGEPPLSKLNSPPSEPKQVAPRQIKLVAIGASTGGPPVLRTIVSSLPANFPAPIVVVQHMASGFTQGFADWLAGSSNYPVHIARDGEQLLGGSVYIAPEGKHIGVTGANYVVLRASAPEHGMRPAVSYLFRSVADSIGDRALGVLLTGMGKDGAAELKLMRDKGAITIAQDFESSVVHGMPGEAIRLGGAGYVRSAEEICLLLPSLVRKANDE